MRTLPAKCEICGKKAVVICSETGSEKVRCFCIDCFKEDLEYILEDFTKFL